MNHHDRQRTTLLAARSQHYFIEKMNGTASVGAAVLGPNFNGTINQWSFVALQKPGDEQAPENESLRDALTRLAEEFETTRIWAPRPVPQNGVMVTRDALTVPFSITKDVTLFRGCNADGVFDIEPGEAFAMSGAGCPVIIGVSGTKMAIAHAGLQSLFDWKQPERMGVATAMIEAFGDYGREHRLKLMTCFAIPPEALTHALDDPRYSEENRMRDKMLRSRWGSSMYVGDPAVCAISIPELVRLQAQEYSHVSLIHHRDMFLKNRVDGTLLAHTRHTGDVEIGEKTVLKKDLRNIVYVARLP